MAVTSNDNSLSSATRLAASDIGSPETPTKPGSEPLESATDHEGVATAGEVTTEELSNASLSHHLAKVAARIDAASGSAAVLPKSLSLPDLVNGDESNAEEHSRRQSAVAGNHRGARSKNIVGSVLKVQTEEAKRRGSVPRRNLPSNERLPASSDTTQQATQSESGSIVSTLSRRKTSKQSSRRSSIVFDGFNPNEPKPPTVPALPPLTIRTNPSANRTGGTGRWAVGHPNQTAVSAIARSSVGSGAHPHRSASLRVSISRRPDGSAEPPGAAAVDVNAPHSRRTSSFLGAAPDAALPGAVEGMFIQDPAAQAGALPKPDPPVFRKRASSVWSQSHVASPTPATDAGSLRSRARSVREVLVGTPVKEGHVNYMLMYDMLTGIRVSVSRCNARQVRELEDADFEAAHKLAFDITGNELTPSSRYDFKFKDYAPFVFRKIRESFRVDTEEYLTSLTGKYMLSELGSPGKSKCFFYFSQDYRFIIKTIHHSEHRFVREVLKEYYEHIRNNPQTLLSRIFGLHRVKLPGNRKIHFVVMGNVMPSNYDVHETYDLKGSTVGRKVPRAQVEKNPRATLKDLNWLENGRKLYLGPEKRELFVGQMEKDVEFLKSMKIMDYSLLVGYHDVTKGNKDRIRDATLSVFQPTPGTLTRHQSLSFHQGNSATISSGNGAIYHGNPGSPVSPILPTAATSPVAGSVTAAFASGVTPAAIAKRISRASTMRRFLGETEIVPFGPSAARLPGSSPAERRCCIFYQTMGGFRATDDANAPLDEVYYLGIIDIFTRYDRNKKVEHFFKSLTNNKTQISAVDPVLYGNRFVSFMTAAIGTQPRSAPAVTAAAAPETVPPSDAVPAVL